jgi:hypothetical protein
MRRSRLEYRFVICLYPPGYKQMDIRRFLPSMASRHTVHPEHKKVLKAPFLLS